MCLCISCKKNDIPKQDTSKSEKTTQILFSKTDLTQNQMYEDVFVNNLILHQDKFLSLHFILKQPLVQSLKKLSPNLSEEELLNKGNFQFSSLVDGKII